MTKMTSSFANKVLRKLNEDKVFWRTKETESCTYVAALDEDPVIPEYDYKAVAATIEEIDKKIVRIKHAINMANLTSRIEVGNETMTVDEILIRMAQLNRRKCFLDDLRKREPKVRISSGSYSARKTAPEYCYINYDLDVVKRDYDRVDEELGRMQMALDKHNQTFEFEVDI